VNGGDQDFRFLDFEWIDHWTIFLGDPESREVGGGIGFLWMVAIAACNGNVSIELRSEDDFSIFIFDFLGKLKSVGLVERAK
jgi:hypothetical protein